MVTASIASAVRTRPSGQFVRDALMAHKRAIFAIFGISGAMSVLALTTSFYMLQVYDRVLASRSEYTLGLLTLIAVVAIVVFGWLDSMRLRLQMRLGMKTANALGSQIMRAMIAMTSQRGGMSMRNGMRDLDTVRGFIGSPGVSAAMDAPFLPFYLVVLALLHPIFLVIVAVGAGSLLVIAWTNRKVTDPQQAESLARQTRAYALSDDGLRNSDVLEGMGMSQPFAQRWHDQWIDGMRVGTAAADRESQFTSASRGVRQAIQIALLGVGALLILDFRATGGIMIAASIIGGRALAPIEMAVANWRSYTAARLAWARLDAILVNAPKRDEGMRLPPPRGQITALRAGYIIPGAGRTILGNVGFELLAGESLGIIGPSASGKSTLCRLIVGAWPCSTGAIRLDGADVYRWPRQELSNFVGFLPQDVELFAGTIRENIARLEEGDPDAVVRAAQLAGTHEMILGLPDGYDTQIGIGGLHLSGGQAQRIGIARALYGGVRLVVLDEPNSNLDGPGEDALTATLAALKAAGVTTIIVAHRPSVLACVDKLLALRNGTVEAFGPRQEVLQRYARNAPAAPSTPEAAISVPRTVSPADPPRTP